DEHRPLVRSGDLPQPGTQVVQTLPLQTVVARIAHHGGLTEEAPAAPWIDDEVHAGAPARGRLGLCHGPAALPEQRVDRDLEDRTGAVDLLVGAQPRSKLGPPR